MIRASYNYSYLISCYLIQHLASYLYIIIFSFKINHGFNLIFAHQHFVDVQTSHLYIYIYIYIYIYKLDCPSVFPLLLQIKILFSAHGLYNN